MDEHGWPTSAQLQNSRRALSRWALASFLLSLLAAALCGAAVLEWIVLPCVGGLMLLSAVLLSFIFSFIAYSEIKRHKDQLYGRVYATAAIVISLITLLGSIFIAPFHYLRVVTPEMIYRINLGRIGQALTAYQQQFEGRNPPDLQTLTQAPEAAAYHIILLCPDTGSEDDCSYIYRGADLTADVPKELILVLEKPANHPRHTNILFADGHLETVEFSQFTPGDPENPIEKDNQLRQQMGLPQIPYPP